MRKIKEKINKFIKQQGDIYNLIYNGVVFGTTFYSFLKTEDFKVSFLCGAIIAIEVAVIRYFLGTDVNKKEA